MGELGCLGQHPDETGGPRLALEGLRLGQPTPRVRFTNAVPIFVEDWGNPGAV
jgi:hypothetical protein